MEARESSFFAATVWVLCCVASGCGDAGAPSASLLGTYRKSVHSCRDPAEVIAAGVDLGQHSFIIGSEMTEYRTWTAGQFGCQRTQVSRVHELGSEQMTTQLIAEHHSGACGAEGETLLNTIDATVDYDLEHGVLKLTFGTTPCVPLVRISDETEFTMWPILDGCEDVTCWEDLHLCKVADSGVECVPR